MIQISSIKSILDEFNNDVKNLEASQEYFNEHKKKLTDIEKKKDKDYAQAYIDMINSGMEEIKDLNNINEEDFDKRAEQISGLISKMSFSASYLRKTTWKQAIRENAKVIKETKASRSMKNEKSPLSPQYKRSVLSKTTPCPGCGYATTISGDIKSESDDCEDNENGSSVPQEPCDSESPTDDQVKEER